MAINASDSGGGVDFEPAPAGSHPARCISIIDLGTQISVFEGDENMFRKAFIMFELPNKMKTYKNKEGDEVTEPFCISGWYTISLSEKANLTKLLEGWRGRAFTDEEKVKFDISVLAGKPCLMNVIGYTKKNGKPGTKIGSAMQLPDGFQCPPQVNPTIVFSLEDYTLESFEKVSEGLQKIIMKSPEYQYAIGNRPAEPLPQTNAADGFDDIPF